MKIKENKSSIMAFGVALTIGLSGGIGIGHICTKKKRKTTAAKGYN